LNKTSVEENEMTTVVCSSF